MNERFLILDITGASRDLHTLSTPQLLRGMAAFDHPPRCSWSAREDLGDTTGCFLWEVFGPQKCPHSLHDGECFCLHNEYAQLSEAYEAYTEWFKGECLRELAERGVAYEPKVREEVAVP